jgi:hypothetical protein
MPYRLPTRAAFGPECSHGPRCSRGSARGCLPTWPLPSRKAVRARARILLTRGGYRVLEAPDGQASPRARPHLPRADLPARNRCRHAGHGWASVARRFSETRPDTRVAFVSATRRNGSHSPRRWMAKPRSWPSRSLTRSCLHGPVWHGECVRVVEVLGVEHLDLQGHSPAVAARQEPPDQRRTLWRQWDSNPRPPACKPGALAS